MENYSPDRPISPPLSFQEQDAPLGSSSASPASSYQHSLQAQRRYHSAIHQSPPTTSDCDSDNEQTFSDFPSLSQHAALATLQDYDNETLFAWLTGLRSFKPGGQNWFQPGYLSPQQLQAIFTLKDCNNSLISAWLDSIRCGGSFKALHNYYGSSYFPVQKAAVTSTRNRWQASSNTSTSSSDSFDPPASPYDSCTTPSTQRSSWGRGSFLDSSGENSFDEPAATLPVPGAHAHWCFVCENPRVFTTCDGWKRHMKEHETRYPCMPHGCENSTAYGPECVLCGVLNPDEIHYDSHKLLPCFNKSLSARSYTRKSHLVNHLKVHGIADGSALAEEWRDTLHKKYFSCGFCIACFHSHTEQLNHIDSAHYKNHQHIGDWDSNNIILGLLLQPGVQESWRNKLAANPEYIGSDFRWSLAAVRSLQLRLEKSEETANILALAAFNESAHSWGQNSRVEPMPVTSFSNDVTGPCQGLPSGQRQATPAQTLLTPDQSSVYDGGTVNTPLQAQHPAWRSIATNHLVPGALNVKPTAYQNNSSQELMATVHDQSCRDVQLGLPSTSNNGWVPARSPSHAPWNGPTSAPSNAYGCPTAISSSLAVGGYRQVPLSPKSLTGQSGQQHNSSTGRIRTAAATQPTSLSSNYPSSPSTQATSFPSHSCLSSLSAGSTNHLSRTKLKDYYDIDTEADMAFDLDNIQCFMRGEKHTRSERRRR